MSRARSVMLGARIVVDRSSLLNETHLLTRTSPVYSSRLVKNNLGVACGREHRFRIKLGSRKILGTILGVPKRKGLVTAGLQADIRQLLLFHAIRTNTKTRPPPFGMTCAVLLLAT